MIFEVLRHLDEVVLPCQLLYKQSLSIQLEHGVSTELDGQDSALLHTLPCLEVFEGQVKPTLIPLYRLVVDSELDYELLSRVVIVQDFTSYLLNRPVSPEILGEGFEGWDVFLFAQVYLLLDKICFLKEVIENLQR